MSAPRVVLRSAPRHAPEGNALSRGMSRILEERSMKRPRFSGYWTSAVPSRAEELECYQVGGAKVKLFSLEGGQRHLYHISPWEHGLPDEIVRAVDDVISQVTELPPPDLEVDYDELRSYVVRTAARLLRKRTEGLQMGGNIEERERTVVRLSEIVARHTVGLGLFEVLLADDRIEDIYVDAPSWENPVHITIGGVAGFNSVCRCGTNITVSGEEMDGLVSKFRQYTLRPFSEAFPALETDLPGYDTRATVIGPPLSPSGPALALRRHSRRPWTLLRLVAAGAFDTYAAALLSFLIDGRSTALICGARGAGKSSMLSAMMFEFPLEQRILAIEDTLELPIGQMQSLGYRIQSLFVDRGMERSAEDGADDALRVSLRLGESAIVMGEVRGREAQTLYQSMRTGRAGSSVLGTIHGESARSVYDRVVHDMGISREAFMATDIVVTMGLSRPGGSTRPVRRLVELSEVSRQRGPGEFNLLLGEGDDGLRCASETIARIAAGWGMEYQDALDNIRARAGMRQVLIDAAARGHGECLGPEWTCRCNEFLWQRMDEGTVNAEEAVDDFRRFVQGRMGIDDLY